MFVLPLPALAQDKAFDLGVPPVLIESGLIDYILPRFSLKTGIKVSVVEGAEVGLGEIGTQVFARDDTIWHLSQSDAPPVTRFRDWLLSDIGKRTIDAFEPASGAPFRTDLNVENASAPAPVEGDAVAGKTLSLQLCGRCHVVAEENRMNAIGSTPSFALMRTFPDWQNRFTGFYTLRPHPAFTQVSEVTPAFEAHLPSPIVPIALTLEDIEAITAYVATILPADLGAPIQSQ
jgi:mono/diheme cytochrome c family protein